MKLTAASVLPLALGASAYFPNPDQHVLGQSSSVPSFLSNAFDQVKNAFGELPADAVSVWEEVAKLYPNDAAAALQALSGMKSKPKPGNKRKHDSEWDIIVDGDTTFSTMDVDGADKLKGTKLRVKKPTELGIDKEGNKQYSGYLDVENDTKHFFFWFFESRNNPETDPVVLWLNGGPGCSSMTGLFFELGPSAVNDKIEVVHNPYAWNSNASVIFLDQPVNVGYSYSDESVSSTEVAAQDVYAFLTLFFDTFTEYAKQPFTITGESYAGHYIPQMAAEILKHKNRNINLQSVAIGNGLTDGLTQYEYYQPMACGEGGYKSVLSESECASMKSSIPTCTNMIKNCYNSRSVWTCVPASIYCNNAQLGPYQRTGANVYDIRTPCEDQENLCYPQMGDIAEYLNKPEVMEAVGAEVSSFDSCNFDINRNFLFHGDWMLPFHDFVPGLLEEIEVMIYAGDADFICNWLGNHAWTEGLEWKGKKAFNSEKLAPFKVADEEKGMYKTSGNFTFMRLFQGGHMVPFDQPESSLEMLNSFLGGKFTEA